MGVSTSRKPSASRKFRIAPTARLRVPHFRVDHQIEVALAVADFDVGEAVPFLRQRQERLRQELQSLGVDGQLASLGPEEVPRDAHEVADVEEFIELPVARAD